MNGKWIRFTVIERKAKTEVYGVITKEGGELLGEIKWFCRWRKYAFFPLPNTIYEPTCLTDITNFITNLMDNRRLNKHEAQGKR